jgi:hypothetical protein
VNPHGFPDPVVIAGSSISKAASSSNGPNSEFSGARQSGFSYQSRFLDGAPADAVVPKKRPGQSPAFSQVFC